jgi:hypothetical protein
VLDTQRLGRAREVGLPFHRHGIEWIVDIYEQTAAYKLLIGKSELDPQTHEGSDRWTSENLVRTWIQHHTLVQI